MYYAVSMDVHLHRSIAETQGDSSLSPRPWRRGGAESRQDPRVPPGAGQNRQITMLNDSGISPTSASAIHAPHYNLETRVDDPSWGNSPHRSPVDPPLLLRHPWTIPSAGNDGRRERERDPGIQRSLPSPSPPPSPLRPSRQRLSAEPTTTTTNGSGILHEPRHQRPQTPVTGPPFLWIPSSSLALRASEVRSHWLPLWWW